ncbi:MAG TPA: hypothetical protein VGE41_06590, partial [Verrucomicrobiae bacterium]
MKTANISALILFLFASALVAKAEEARPPALNPDGQKFLFVVDTSASMQRLPHNGRQTVFDMIYSGLWNQLAPGDSIGVWTFNQDVQAGKFAMQVWDPDQDLALASRVGLFLKGQHYEHKAQLNEAFKSALGLVKSVKDLNVLVITDGQSSLGQSKLEIALKDRYQTMAEQARKGNKPMVLAFHAIGGEVLTNWVTLAGEPIKFPKPLAKKKLL